MKRSTAWQSGVAVLGVVLLVAAMNSPLPGAWAGSKGYVFTPLAFLGDPTPGGDTYLDVFESNFINNRGDVLFQTNVTANVEQALFLMRKGETSQLVRFGEPAPGGGTFVSGVLSPTTLNDKGDAAFVFLLDPFTFPLGVNAGVYHFSAASGSVTPVVIPGVTPAPGGGVFAGSHFGVSLNNEGTAGLSRSRADGQGHPVPGAPRPGRGDLQGEQEGDYLQRGQPGGSGARRRRLRFCLRSLDQQSGRCRLHGPRGRRRVPSRELAPTLHRHRLSPGRLRQERGHGRDSVPRPGRSGCPRRRGISRGHQPGAERPRGCRLPRRPDARPPPTK